MKERTMPVLNPRVGVHGGPSHLLPRLVAAAAACLLLAPPSRAATVVTRLPGFDGALPFRLETGYVGVDDATGAELFYYLVELERSPRADPLVLWHSGGPRCSALSALAFQIGPVMFADRRYDGALPRLVRNPYSLTQMASILFVDSPVGTGFSYARDPRGYDVGDISASLQLLTFLRKWFDDHPWYLSNPFYLGGDSYAGKGYIVGNPATGDKIDENSKIPYCHSFGIISDQLYEAAVINCKGDYANPTNKLCSDVVQIINDLKSEVDKQGILDPVCPVASPKPRRDALRRKSLAEEHYPLMSGPPEEPPFGCPAYRYYLSYFWANDNATRASLGIKEGTVMEWIRCKISGELPYTSDLPSSIEYHLNLTTRGYRALVYSGDHDLTVPFSGTQAWIRYLNFSIVDDWRAWHLDYQAAGFTITYANNLTFATIKGDDGGGGRVGVQGLRRGPVPRAPIRAAEGRRRALGLPPVDDAEDGVAPLNFAAAAAACDHCGLLHDAAGGSGDANNGQQAMWGSNGFHFQQGGAADMQRTGYGFQQYTSGSGAGVEGYHLQMAPDMYSSGDHNNGPLADAYQQYQPRDPMQQHGYGFQCANASYFGVPSGYAQPSLSMWSADEPRHAKLPLEYPTADAGHNYADTPAAQGVGGSSFAMGAASGNFVHSQPALSLAMNTMSGSGDNFTNAKPAQPLAMSYGGEPTIAGRYVAQWQAPPHPQRAGGDQRPSIEQLNYLSDLEDTQLHLCGN
ncbi:hypothetical protein C2845_PM01G29450 [Panicum miliaceum]|uniref:Serine carboxypeptidase-like 18 n=1 Tax=Panicum miliaceum TaxID=4540 RepID=A0A3L6TGV1_PANMI|nr:hypothetical protein C2845_PM01G29450 [Panicum miliaceum]